MKLLATILSTIFHPLLMPTYGIAIALYTSYMRVFGDRLLGIIVIGVLLTTCILPSLGIFILYKTGHISDFRLHNRTERTVPYIINFVCYIACYLYLYRFGIPNWILSFIAGAIVSLIISLFINRYWKISAHLANNHHFACRTHRLFSYFTESTHDRPSRCGICIRSHVLRIFIFPIHIKPITDNLYLL